MCCALQVVFLDFNHHYAMDAAHHVYLIDMLQEVFGSRLCHNCAVDSITLDYLWGKKHQVRLGWIDKCVFNFIVPPWSIKKNVHVLESTLQYCCLSFGFPIGQPT